MPNFEHNIFKSKVYYAKTESLHKMQIYLWKKIYAEWKTKNHLCCSLPQTNKKLRDAAKIWKKVLLSEKNRTRHFILHAGKNNPAAHYLSRSKLMGGLIVKYRKICKKICLKRQTRLVLLLLLVGIILPKMVGIILLKQLINRKTLGDCRPPTSSRDLHFPRHMETWP